MRLVQLVYYSHATEPMTHQQARQIVAKASQYNQRLHITGMLTCSRSHFLQAVEGPRRAVCDLFERIGRDQRHDTVTLIDYREVHERSFSAWSMGFVGLAETDETLLRFSPTPTFDPANLNQPSALALLVELSRQDRSKIKVA